eukprot:CAMPEP_0118699950 /NCGR_PEP_ID=MMETSP0800-20121206/16247_1 /TAXON_ID=210618 ORGANISM="Striatella unipunctata, Strain CCMP2910" /NCGR_SAMPLE_ID=MMETSP0800 /ASSEMBLY_ACC=CAM_ASM_000638 /LENGTH=128 /DNA_ID=CAMNT_0006600351 /DNA_START=331 /DNA_END=717 /DNA_ORIENTATION=-
MIFDSNHPTGGDSDLKFSNRGKILILSEDGDRRDPDDSAKGGSLFFHFDRPVRVESFILLDVERHEIGQITLFNAHDDIIFDSKIHGHGDNTQKVIHTGPTNNVKSMVVRLAGSGAIDDIRYTITCPK